MKIDVISQGALGDGMTVNTSVIQKAIDLCGRSGGGTVYFPSGSYVSGTLFLKSNVTLELSSGAESKPGYSGLRKRHASQQIPQ